MPMPLSDHAGSPQTVEPLPQILAESGGERALLPIGLDEWSMDVGPTDSAAAADLEGDRPFSIAQTEPFQVNPPQGEDPFPDANANANPDAAPPSVQLADPADESLPAATEGAEGAEDADSTTDNEPGSLEPSDPELGILRLREREVVRPRPPAWVYGLGRVGYFRSDNILLDLDPVDDQLFRAGISLLARPALGPQTSLVTAVEGNFIRYSDLSVLDYNELQLRAGVRHFFSNRAYGELSWVNQQLFTADEGDRFINDHSARLTLARRDPLGNRLALDSFYQLRLSLTDPSDRSRVINTLGTALTYYLQPDLKASLDYQLLLSDFTRQDRNDFYSQVVAQLTYDLSRRTRITLFGGFSFGDSTNNSIDFNSSILGLTLDVSLPLF